MVNKKKRADVFIETSAHSLVHPMRIELISSEPESGILSIELRVPFAKAVQKYTKSFSLPNISPKIPPNNHYAPINTGFKDNMQTKNIFLLAI